MTEPLSKINGIITKNYLETQTNILNAKDSEKKTSSQLK